MGGSASIASLRFTPVGVCSFLICLTCLVYICLSKRIEKVQNKLFLLIVLDVGVCAASDVSAELARVFAVGDLAVQLVQFSDYVHYASHVALAPLFFLYVLMVCRDLSATNWVRNNVIGMPFYLTELIALTNPLTNWMYSYGPDLMVVRHWGMYLAYLVGILYTVLGFLQLIRRWRALTVVRRRALIYFFLLAGTSIVVQLLVPYLRFEIFAESLVVFGIMMFVESEDGLIDFESGVYNRHAMEADLDMYSKSAHSYSIVVVRVTNVDSYLHVGGTVKTAQAITEMLADYFKQVMPWYNIYRAAPMRYALVNPRLSYEEAQRVAVDISERFRQGWHLLDIDLDLKAVVVVGRVPEDLPATDDVFYLIDTPVPPIAGKDVLVGDDLDYLVRRAEVERAVQRGFDEGAYEVYYQPIFDADGKPKAAEALMRLHDAALGDIGPSEFIEVAERMGLVDAVGEFALREVCAFLASGVPQGFGIKHISVNLSVIQCMQMSFAFEAKNIVNSYGIDPNSMTFEITESVATGDFEYLRRVVNQLKRSGHRFAMDDYGTGYSNMHSLVALDFDVVKIDKSMLWDAEKSDMGLVILRDNVKTMRDIGCDVLVEGVETERQVDLLKVLNVDYYQGFYYAKPMPKDEFVSFLETVTSSGNGFQPECIYNG